MAVCPNCGTESPDAFKFCPACATRLDQTPQPQAEERKVVSILFVDLVGFTARSHDLDPEDVRAALQPYHQRLKREIEGFGGTVEKFIGDAVMAVFGAPVSHEDDAERAVRAALRITEAIEELNEGANLDLSIRAAVNTGEGLVSLSARPHAGEGMVTGDVVNTASRLQGIAPVGGVAVGEVTYRTTKDFIVYEEMDPVAVKGKPQPVPVWRALSARSRFGVDVETRFRTPFIGREVDLTLLKTSYQKALRESSLQLVTIVGSPGQGKSRLLAEFSSYIDEEDEIVFWRQGRSLPYGEGITFWALGEIVKAQAGINESDSPHVAAGKVRASVNAVVSDESDQVWLQSRIAPLVGAATGDEGAEKEESFTAWVRFLEAIAAKSTLVLVFEDLHWADASMLEFIEHLVEWSTGVPILVIATARPELFEKHPTWAAGSRAATTISLSPLSDSEIAQLISALLSQAVLPAEIHSALLERAGGNPLYAEQFIQMLSDQGVLRQRGRTMALDPHADIPIPGNVQALIAARFDTLSSERKSLLYDAAVVGKVFWSGAVAAIGGIDNAVVKQGLHELARKELVRPARLSSMEGQQEYSFWHALIRDVAYGQIPRSTRGAKHRDVAHWLEHMASDRAGDHAEVLAHHYESAMDLLASGSKTAEAAELRTVTVRFLILAGERAAPLDPEKAYRYYARALTLISESATEQGDVLLRAGRLAHLSSHFDEAEGHYKAAIAASRKVADRMVEGEATARLAVTHYYQGRSGREGIKTAIALLESGPPTAALAYAQNLVGQEALFSEGPEMAVQAFESALEVAEAVGDAREALAARFLRAEARLELGHIEEGLREMREVIGLGLSLGLTDVATLAETWLPEVLWLTEGAEAGLANYQAAAATAEHRGQRAAAQQARIDSLWPLYDLGKWAALLMTTDEFLTASGTQSAVPAAVLRAQVLAWQGGADKAQTLLNEALPVARDVGDLRLLVPCLAIAALAWSIRGDVSQAVVLISELDSATRNRSPWRSRHLPTALKILVDAGDIAKAEAFAAGLEVHALRDWNCVVSGQAIIAEAEGQIDEARNLYKEAAQRWADYGFVLEEGQAHLGLARCLITLGNSHAATEPLQKARGIFSRLGAVPLIQEVDRYFGQATALSS